MATRTAPNLFIVGSPKCGTSSLHNWLAQVPGIAQARYKELRYVLDEDNPLIRPVNFHTHGLTGWLGAYPPDAVASAHYLLDSTPEYQRQRTALDAIGALAPRPHVLLVFRKPSERIYSLYQFAKYHQSALDRTETFDSFVAEVAAGGHRFAGHPMLVNAFSETAYGDIAEDWIAAVGADRVKILLLENIEANPEVQIRDVLTWLDLDPALAAGISFEVVNKTANMRWPRLRHAVGRIVQRFPVLRRARAPRDIYRRVMTGSVSGEEYGPSAAGRAQLDARFAETVAQLGRHIDVTPWGIETA